MSDIVFYTNPQSRGRIVHWMLEELAEPYETQWIDYGEQMKSEPYISINPMGKVPAITYKGTPVTEVPAICTFLAAVYPEKGLIPKDAADLAAFYRWMFFAASALETAVTARSLGWEITPEQKRTVGFGDFDDTMDTAEKALANGPFICGDQFTAVDVYFGAHLHWGMQFGTMPKRPAFEDYVARIGERPALKRADEINAEKLQQQE